MPVAARRRELGAFYTPRVVVDHMVALLGSPTADAGVLEPSGGDGAFVEGLQAAGWQPEQVEVWDINPAVATRLEQLGVTWSVRDSLLAPLPRRRFTHVIGNPPYLNKQSAYMKENRAALRDRFAHIGLSDTYAMFLALGMELLRPGGRMAMLVSDSFLTLGTHARLRSVLLSSGAVESVTLLPRATFPEASVATAVVVFVKGAPPGAVTFVDCKDRPAGDFGGSISSVSQADLAELPGTPLVAADQVRLLRIAAGLPPLMSHCSGGLGMHTGDNARFLRPTSHLVDGRRTVFVGSLPGSVRAESLGGSWRPYHKVGGARRWWHPVEYAVRWDAQSRAHYSVPASVQRFIDSGMAQRGVIVSGVSDAFAARLAWPGALWDSNKAFCLFPDSLAPEFLLAVLNSSFMARVASALNHTASFQVRDLKRLPMLPFSASETAELTRLGVRAVDLAREGQPVVEVEVKIDSVVDRVLGRVASEGSRSPLAGALLP